MVKHLSVKRRLAMRWACRAFSTREEESIWLEMCDARTVSYLRNAELIMLHEILGLEA
jgi:hypothetical protein